MLGKKLEGMSIKKKMNHGYKIVIILMIISGIFVIIGLNTLFGTLRSYINGVQKADNAVKICRIDVNVAARYIREMALAKDSSSYDTYKNEVYDKLNEVDTQLKTLKKTGKVSDELYQEYSQALQNWGTIGNDIISEIEEGDSEAATDKILNKCSPALDQVVSIAQKLDEQTSTAASEAIRQSYISFIGGIIVTILFIVAATLASRSIGNKIVVSITEPLDEIEKVANELAAGNLHSNLEYHSDDEIGVLAHNMRKSIRILGSYVDDISHTMGEFSKGNFDVVPEVEWRGDFKGILDAFTMFE